MARAYDLRRLAIVAAGCVCALAPPSAATDVPPLSVQLTSPLGRTGLPGTIRIVARVLAPDGVPLDPVRFYVDGVLQGEDAEGPPYAVTWVDEHPFSRTEIAVEVSDALGRHARDAVTLRPFEIAERAEVRSVLLEASVQDREGRYIGGLGRERFELLEDGTPQTIDIVRPDRLPATYALLVDNSQSMARQADFLRHAALRICDVLRPDDRVVVVPFTRTIGAVTGPTGDRDTIVEAVRAVNPRGGTAILDAVALVAPVLGAQAPGPQRRVMVLLSDGYDEHSTVSFDEALASAQQHGVTVYVVGIAGVAGISLRGERDLRRLARETGGTAFFPSREADVPAAHARVASDVANRYLITYTPTNQRSDGAWRAIALTADDRGLTVRVRPGYFAPKPPPVRASLEFTVTDDGDRYLPVSRDQLLVLEDGVRQDVDTFHEAVDPVAIVMALDASGSMRPATEAVKNAARSFVEALRPEDSLAVFRFADGVFVAHDLTFNRQHALEAIDAYTAAGGTALYDSVFGAAVRLAREEARRIVVVLSDGRDEDNPGTGPGSTHALAEALEKVRETATTVFAIGLGPTVDRETLERLARESGGRAYFPEDVSALAAQYAKVLEDLRRRYVLGYTSTDPTHDGRWRAVDIRLTGAEARIRSKGGYFAPAQ